MVSVCSVNLELKNYDTCIANYKNLKYEIIIFYILVGWDVVFDI